MSATENGVSELSAGQAVREVLRIERRSSALLQRTAGMTWMFWALINGGIFVSYEAISLAAPTGGEAWLEYGLAWAPWVALGGLATLVLWRSLAIAVPPAAGGLNWVTPVTITIFLGLVLGGLAALSIAHIPVNAALWAMFAVGVAAALVGGSGLTTRIRSERLLWVGGGVGLALLAVASELLAGGAGAASSGLFLVLGPVASTALLFGGGLYTASA